MDLIKLAMAKNPEFEKIALDFPVVVTNTERIVEAKGGGKGKN